MQFSLAKQRVLVVGGLLLWSASLVLLRMFLGAGWHGIGLLWNLLLAVIPLLWSTAFERAIARGRPIVAGLCFILWLLFLPNAPYLLTDVIHLAPRPPIPLWFVLAMLLSCAATGTLRGYLSLRDVQAVVERKWGAALGWIVAIGSLIGCGFGIYLGRFLRWNSWDALTQPVEFVRVTLGQFIDAGGHPHPLAVTLVYGGGLVLGYLALRVIGASNRAVG